MECTYKDLLSAIHKTTHIRPTVFDAHDHIIYTAHVHAEKILDASSEIHKVVSLCRKTKKEHIFISYRHLAIAAIYVEASQDVILLGHIFLGTKSEQEIQYHLLKNYHDEEVIKRHLQDIMGLHVCSKSNLLLVMNILNQYLNHHQIDETREDFIIMQEELSMVSSIASVRDDFVFSDEKQRNVNPYDDYLYEQQLMDCIEKGDQERLLSTLQYEQPSYAASLSNENDLLRQRKNEFICACTLATRAAIRGGMNVEQAYAMGNYYIKQREESNVVEGNITNDMFLDFTTRVKNLVKLDSYSSIVKECMVYVNDHVHDAIAIQEIADHIGVSKNHLLIKFKDETKQSIVDYIKHVKIAEAKLLLQYTNMPIVEISESLAFSSQSFFTSVFRQTCSQTPKQYRETHK